MWLSTAGQTGLELGRFPGYTVLDYLLRILQGSSTCTLPYASVVTMVYIYETGHSRNEHTT